MFYGFDVFRISTKGLNFYNFADVAHKIEKSKYVVNIENESHSPMNLSENIVEYFFLYIDNKSEAVSLISKVKHFQLFGTITA